jgi:hypothetical protein
MTWVPDACTLLTEEVPLRVAEFNALFASTLRRVERPAPGLLRLTLEASAETIAQDLVARESACCAFFDFTIKPDGDGRLRLDVAVPAGHEPILDALAHRAATACPEAAT